jgi:hypothetical protein
MDIVCISNEALYRWTKSHAQLMLSQLSPAISSSDHDLVGFDRRMVSVYVEPSIPFSQISSKYNINRLSLQSSFHSTRVSTTMDN